MSAPDPSSQTKLPKLTPAKLAPAKLLVAASGTGGHLFPAIATAEQLADFHIEWLGVPDRLERQLVPDRYCLHTIPVQGFQQQFGWGTLKILSRLVLSILKVRQILQQGNFQALLTTGGYIAAPSILAAWSLGLPVVLHESNALPGKVTRWLSPFCSVVAIGFTAAEPYLPKAKTLFVGTPVRSQFRVAVAEQPPLDLPIPVNVPLIVVLAAVRAQSVSINWFARWLQPGLQQEFGLSISPETMTQTPKIFSIPTISLYLSTQIWQRCCNDLILPSVELEQVA